jgi:hypothetical protein
MNPEMGPIVVWLTLAAIAVAGELIYRVVARARKRR